MPAKNRRTLEVLRYARAGDRTGALNRHCIYHGRKNSGAYATARYAADRKQMLSKSRALILHPRKEYRGLVSRIDSTALCRDQIDRVFLLVLFDVVSGLEPFLEFHGYVALGRLRRRVIEQAYLVVVGQIGHRKSNHEEENDRKIRQLVMERCQTDVNAECDYQQRIKSNEGKSA